MLNLEYVEVFWVNLDLTSISKAIQEENDRLRRRLWFSGVWWLICAPLARTLILWAVGVCAHTDMHSKGEDRHEEIRTLCSILLGSRGTADLDYIEIWDRLGPGVQYSYLCPYEFVYSIVERLNLYDGFGNTS